MLVKHVGCLAMNASSRKRSTMRVWGGFQRCSVVTEHRGVRADLTDNVVNNGRRIHAFQSEYQMAGARVAVSKESAKAICITN